MTANEARSIPPEEESRALRSRAISTGPPRLTPFRELQLVEAHRNGDAEALAELLQAYQRRVYAICYRMVRDVDEASDLTQDALVKIIEGLDRYDGRSKLSTWVIRVTMNNCLSYLRKKKVRRTRSLEETEFRDQFGSSKAGAVLPAARSGHDPRDAATDTSGRPLGELSSAARVEQAEQRKGLLKAMMRLEPEQRAILVLRDLHDLEYEQIGVVLEVPVGTVKSRLFRARTALRKEFESSSDGDEPTVKQTKQ